MRVDPLRTCPAVAVEDRVDGVRDGVVLGEALDSVLDTRPTPTAGGFFVVADMSTLIPKTKKEREKKCTGMKSRSCVEQSASQRVGFVPGSSGRPVVGRRPVTQWLSA